MVGSRPDNAIQSGPSKTGSNAKTSANTKAKPNGSKMEKVMKASSSKEKSAAKDKSSAKAPGKKPEKPGKKPPKAQVIFMTYQEKPKFGCYFNDGIRRVDYILVWEQDLNEKVDDKLEAQRAFYRSRFESNLLDAGVEIEMATSVNVKKRIHYLKLFVSWQTMCYYAEYLGFRAPLELFTSSRASNRFMDKMSTKISSWAVPNKPVEFYTCAFSVSKLNMFHGSHDQDTYFKPTQRFEVAFEILGTLVYGQKDLSEVGLDRMIKEGIYTSAFPPHDGTCEVLPNTPTDHLNARQVLHHYWARWNQWYKFQPIDHIREYFGEKIAFYFAFMGFYTTWLLPITIAGILAFLYGCLTLGDSKLVKETCESGQTYKMCPICDNEIVCPYWYVSDICRYIQLAYLIDNDSTVAYSLFLSFWACTFLENWKRKSSALAYHWDVTDYEDEQESTRPEYAAKCTEYARDPVTGNMEPHFPYVKRIPRLILGVVSLIVMMMLSTSCMIVMLVSRSLILASLFRNEMFRSSALVIANLASAVIDLVLVLILELLYEKLAVTITEWEMHRTQTEFENRLIIKVFVFELFNYYVSIAYTALVKGNAAGKPGSYNYIMDVRLADCVSGSCMLDLAQILAVITIGKQLAVNVIEYMLPKLFILLRQRVLGVKIERKTKQWEADYVLLKYDEGLFMEYLEVILQFGFITLFGPAFPLAPLFALLNNLMEIRLDARKLVFDTQRPLPERAQGIGLWFSMLQLVVYLATLSNAFLMAFTSEFLPRLTYTYMFDPGLNGYRNFTLNWAPENTTTQRCRYNSVAGLEVTGNNEYYWKLFAARLIFALGYQQLIVSLSSLINYVIPDIPEDLVLKIKRQKYLTKQALAAAESRRRSMRPRL